MTVKDICYELARAGGKVLSGIGSAAVEVLRQSDFQEPVESDLERSARETQEFYNNSPLGDGNYMQVPDGAERASR